MSNEEEDKEENQPSNEEGATQLNEEDAQKNFKRIFEDVVDLLKFTVDTSEEQIKGFLPVDLDVRLSQLEQEVNEFCDLNKKIYNKGKPTEKNLSDEEKKIYDRSKKVLQEAEEKLAGLDIRLKAAQAKGILPAKDEGDAQKRYKRFGRQKRWDKL